MAMEEVPNSGFHGAQSAQDQLPWQRESHTHEGIGSDPKSLLKNAFLKISSLGDTFASSSRSNSLLVHATSRNRIFLWSLHWPLQHFDPWPQALFESLDSGCSERWKTRTWPRHTVSEDLSGVCGRNFVLMKDNARWFQVVWILDVCFWFQI